MKELLERIGSYNIFNYLFPGVVYVGIVSEVTDINIVVDNLFVGAFLYYFIGLIISRVGSLVIEPILKKFRIVKYSDYGAFIEASKKDEKLNLFEEVINMYRTLVSLSVFLLFSVLYDQFILPLDIKLVWKALFFALFLMVLFIFSYRKQILFLRKRMDIGEEHC